MVAEFLPMHPLEFRILLALGTEPRHGYAVVKEVEQASPAGTKVFPANLYRRIRNLLRRGLLEEATGEDSDPRRKYFVVTPLGARVVRAEVTRLRDLLSQAERSPLLARQAP